MANVKLNANVTFGATLTITEVEVRALDALTGYGDDAFIKVFYEKLGTAYMRDHEAGLRSFFLSVRQQVLPALLDIDHARMAIAKDLLARAQSAGAR